MRTAILTDMHANREATEAVLAHARRERAERFVFLGDFVGYGADPGWVVDLVREHVAGGAIAVLGNHDDAVVAGPSAAMNPEARLAVEWTRSQLSHAQIDFLASLPIAAEDGELLFVHANAWEPRGWGYVAGTDEAKRSLLATGRRITVCGHMHEPQLYQLAPSGRCTAFSPRPGIRVALIARRRWLIVPGSVGQPRDRRPDACWAMLDDEAGALVTWRVRYDFDVTGAKIRAAALPERFAWRLADGI
jgi:diadenosine tetraphosphatase ApaH/serine/threonine PP2A family protein phosphatase